MSARSLLDTVSKLERLICLAAFAVMTIALLADVISRKLLQTGLVGATEVAVMAMVALSMAGIGIATDAAAHFRLNALDRLIPAPIEGVVDRLAAFLTAVFFGVLLALTILMISQALALGDRTEILRVPIWILQCFLALAFLTNMLRFLVYALKPDLRPVGETSGGDAVAGEDA